MVFSVAILPYLDRRVGAQYEAYSSAVPYQVQENSLRVHYYAGDS